MAHNEHTSQGNEHLRMHGGELPRISRVNFRDLEKGYVEIGFAGPFAPVTVRKRIGTQVKTDARGRLELEDVALPNYDPAVVQLIPFLETGSMQMLPADTVALATGAPFNRGILLYLPDDAGGYRQFCVSGFGIGYPDSTQSVTAFANPEAGKSIQEVARGMGIHSFGTTYLDQQGQKVHVHTDEPVGAYSESQLKRRLAKAEQLSTAAKSVHVPVIRATGYYKGLQFQRRPGEEPERVGWHIYEVPPSISGSIAFQISRSVDAEFRQKLNINNYLLYTLGAFLRDLHTSKPGSRPAFSHNQMHANNTGLVLRDRSFEVVVTDPETLTSLDSFSPAVQKHTRIHELGTILRRNFELLFRHKTPLPEILEELLDQAAWMQAGYSGLPARDQTAITQIRQMYAGYFQELAQLYRDPRAHQAGFRPLQDAFSTEYAAVLDSFI